MRRNLMQRLTRFWKIPDKISASGMRQPVGWRVCQFTVGCVQRSETHHCGFVYSHGALRFASRTLQESQIHQLASRDVSLPVYCCLRALWFLKNESRWTGGLTPHRSPAAGVIRNASQHYSPRSFANNHALEYVHQRDAVAREMFSV